jgi:hypothetical protein
MIWEKGLRDRKMREEFVFAKLSKDMARKRRGNCLFGWVRFQLAQFMCPAKTTFVREKIFQVSGNFHRSGISLISHHLSLGMLRLAIKKTGDFECLFTGIEVRYYAHSTEVGFTQQAFPLRFLIG